MLRVFVDDITALLKGVNREVAEMAKKVMKKLKEEVERQGLCGFQESELRQYSKEGGVTMTDSVETLGQKSKRAEESAE